MAAGVALHPALPPVSRTWTATVRSIADGSPPAARAAASTPRGQRRDPLGRFPNPSNQAFQASTCGAVIASIRSPLEPTMSGGPPGRGPRGTSSQSRAV